MIEEAADWRIFAMIRVFRHPENVADLVDWEIHLETTCPEHGPQKWNPVFGQDHARTKNREIACG